MYSSVILAIILYILLFWVRSLQGGWEIHTEVFSHQRQFLDSKITALLPSPQAELLSGILLGNKKDLPIGLKLALRDTSTLHIVVVSGQNLSLVAGFFLTLSGLLRRKVAIGLSLMAVLVYTLLTGAQVPVLRAAIMVTLAFLASIYGRERDGWWILVVTGGLMLLINPKWITDISFQLSFLATMGVVVVAPLLLKYLQKVPLIGQDLAVTLSAQAMVMPIIAQNFHQFSLVSVFANLLVLWTIPFIMIGGFLMLLVGVVWGVGGSLVALGLNALLTYFIYIVQFFASLSFAWIYIGESIWIVWMGYYLLLASMLLLMHGKQSFSSSKATDPGRS